MLEVISAAETDTGAVITGSVSGIFPGSSVVSNYHLSIVQDQITALKCLV